MDWSNERYVRLYTRDTPQRIALGWEAQNLAAQLFRVLDRSGVLDLGSLGPMGVAVVLHEVGRWDGEIKPALAKLLDADVFRIVGTKLIAPNFIEAQEAPQSDRMRKAESRARRRDLALNGDLLAVTKRDIRVPGVSASGGSGESAQTVSAARVVTLPATPVTLRDPNGTKGAGSVTSGHVESRSVTPCRAVPCLEESGSGSGGSASPSANFSTSADHPSSSGEPPDGLDEPLLRICEPRAAPKRAARDSARPEAAAWLEWFNRRFGRHFELRDEVVAAVRALRAKHFTQEDMRLVALFKRSQWEGKADMAHLLVPATLLRVKTFGGYLDAAREWFDAEERKNHG